MTNTQPSSVSLSSHTYLSSEGTQTSLIFRRKKQVTTDGKDVPTQTQQEQNTSFQINVTASTYNARFHSFQQGTSLLSFKHLCVLAAQLCQTLCDPMGCSPPGPSVRGILPARILEWVAIPFSRGSFLPRDRTQISFLCRQILYCLSHQGSPP